MWRNNLPCHLSGYSWDTEFVAKTYLVTVGQDVQTFCKNEGSRGVRLVRRRGRFKGVISSVNYSSVISIPDCSNQQGVF